MKDNQNEVRIVVHSHSTNSGYYCIDVKRKWFIFPYWSRVYRFLGTPVGAWNPVLLKYDEAKSFALKIKDKAFLDDFNKKETLDFLAWEKTQKELAKKIYPIDEEEL